MDTLTAIRSRRSVRNYIDREVEEEKLIAVLECARLSPSWENKQCWHFIVVRDRKTIEGITDTFVIINSWLKKAPVVIVACGDPRSSGEHNGVQYYAVDVAIAMQNMMIAATSLGLGTCWIGSFDEDRIRNVLKVPRNLKIVAMTPLGYQAEKQGLGERTVRKLIGSDRRKPMNEIVHFDSW